MSNDSWAPLRPIPSHMTAVTMRSFGGPDVLRAEQMEVPTPGSGEVLVQVRAVSVGRLLDVVARSGRHPYAQFTFPHILGAEHAGVVAAVAPDVTGVEVGTRVAVFPVVVPGIDDFVSRGYPELSPALEIIGTHRQGAYAQYTTVPAENVFAVPSDVSPLQATALALAGAVAMNQFDRADLRHAANVVVQGATSALGMTTALLARHLGHDVVVTSRHRDKRQQLHDLGFTHVFDATDEAFPEMVQEAFGGRGADLVIDNLGAGIVWEHSLAVLAPGGVLVSSGAFLGHEVIINLQRLYSLGQRVIGVRTGNLPSARRLWDEVQKGFRSSVDVTFPLTEAARAHDLIEQDGNFGRLALLVD